MLYIRLKSVECGGAKNLARGKNAPAENEFRRENHFTRGRSVFGRLIEILSPWCRILYLPWSSVVCFELVRPPALLFFSLSLRRNSGGVRVTG